MLKLARDRYTSLRLAPNQKQCQLPVSIADRTLVQARVGSLKRMARNIFRRFVSREEQRSGKSIASFRGKQAGYRHRSIWLSGNPFSSFHDRPEISCFFLSARARNDRSRSRTRPRGLSHQIWLHVLLFNNRCNASQHYGPLIQLRARQTKRRCTTGYHGRVLSAYVSVLPGSALCYVVYVYRVYQLRCCKLFSLGLLKGCADTSTRRVPLFFTLLFGATELLWL